MVDENTLNNLIQGLPVGSTLTLRVLRDGTSQNVNVTLRERPATFGMAPPRRPAADASAADAVRDAVGARKITRPSMAGLFFCVGYN